jgi:hypothetical protein
VKILFLGRRYAYFRNFESVIGELAARGHHLHLAVERDESSATADGRPPIVDALAAKHSNITFGEAPSRSDDEWGWVASRLRLGLDYLRYQHPLFDDTPKLRARARERTPGAFVAVGNGIRRVAPWARGAASAFIRRMERAVPQDEAIRRFIEAQQPDAVLVTPLIDLGSSQIDYVRAARALGVPSALCVWSWDHLSSKALIRELPERVLVWNETQKREAVELHGVPGDRVVVTGAQCFDRWFGRRPSRTRAEFCAEVGFPAERPFVLYVCSALFHGSPSEARFVVEWIRGIRAAASEPLRSAPILVRPHPSRTGEWDGVDLAPFGNAVRWGGNPVDERSRADYFDSLYHSAAVVGLNTSAFIEAGIVGRPVHTVLLPDFRENQMGTVHFRYLLEAGGGLVQAASSLEEHWRQLGSALSLPASEVKPFVREFVRPRGLDVAATPLFVDAVESMRGLAVARESRDPLQGIWRSVFRSASRLRSVERFEALTCSERELDGIRRLRGFTAEKAQRAAEHEIARAAEARRRADARAVRDAEAQAHREAKRRDKARQAAEKEARLAEHRAAKRSRVS